jgi:TPR repeat protein
MPQRSLLGGLKQYSKDSELILLLTTMLTNLDLHTSKDLSNLKTIFSQCSRDLSKECKNRFAQVEIAFLLYSNNAWGKEMFITKLKQLPLTHQNEVITIITEAEKNNNAIAKYYLAIMHKDGLFGQVKNEKFAFQLFREAANANISQAMVEMAKFYRSANEVVTVQMKEAINWYQKAANLENTTALYELGVLYYQGQEEVGQDIPKAKELLERAARLGSHDSLYFFGKIGYDGQGEVPADLKLAINWYKQSAAHGSIKAAEDLGDIYLNGETGVVDGRMALKYYQQAYDGGSKYAPMQIGQMYLGGRAPLETDWHQAQKWLMIAVERGEPGATYALGYIYKNGGHGVQANLFEALYWYKQAAENDQNKDRLNAMLALAFAYTEKNENGQARDISKAIYWFNQAVLAKDPRGAISLSLIYSRGSDGIAVSLHDSNRFFNLAMNLKLENAMDLETSRAEVMAFLFKFHLSENVVKGYSYNYILTELRLAMVFAQKYYSLTNNDKYVLKVLNEVPKELMIDIITTRFRIKYKDLKEEIRKNFPSCMICLIDFTDDHLVFVLKNPSTGLITGVFEVENLESWLKTNSTDPLTRKTPCFYLTEQDIVSTDEKIDTDVNLADKLRLYNR